MFSVHHHQKAGENAWQTAKVCNDTVYHYAQACMTGMDVEGALAGRGLRSLSTLKSTEAVPRGSLPEAERGQPPKISHASVRTYSRHIRSYERGVRVSLIAYLESTTLKRSGF